MEDVAARHRQSVLTTLAMLSLQRDVMSALAAADVSAAVLKGAPLAIDAFGDVTARTSVDVDVLVDPDDVGAATRTRGLSTLPARRSHRCHWTSSSQFGRSQRCNAPWTTRYRNADLPALVANHPDLLDAERALALARSAGIERCLAAGLLMAERTLGLFLPLDAARVLWPPTEHHRATLRGSALAVDGAPRAVGHPALRD